MKAAIAMHLPVLFCLILAGAGCRTTVNTLEHAEGQGLRQPVSDRRIITDGTLNRRVSLVGVNTATGTNGIMSVQVEVENRTSNIQTFFYKFEWFDASGMQVGSAGGGWTERQILGRESIMIQAAAPHQLCRDFRLKLMENPK